MIALISTGRRSPEPSRECSSMFLTMESARWPCCTTLPRLSYKVPVSSLTSSRTLPGSATGLSTSFNSSVNSDETAAKLFTKLSAFLISCAMPAVSCPSAAIFCAWTRLACAACKSRNAVSAASRAARMAFFGLLPVGDVGVDQHEAAAGNRIPTHLDDAAIGPRALDAQLLPGVFVGAAQLSFEIGRVIAPISKIAEELGIAWPSCKEGVRQIKYFL